MNKALMSVLISLWPFSASGFAQVRELPTPAGQGSGQPNLAVAPDGRVYLSWIERLGEGRFSLRFATREGDGWSTPKVIAEGSNWFVNWADFPSMVALPDGSLAAHWLVKSGQGTYEYDVTISRSFDGGKTWSNPFVPHRDGAKAEHGFVSLFTAKDGSLAAVWLDGREMKPGEGSHDHGRGNMTLRYVKIKRDGALVDNANGLQAAWETQGQVYFASLDPKNQLQISPIPAPGDTGKRKHPMIAANSRGETMLVWTEGTGWKKGGSLAWQLYDSQGKPAGEKGAEQGIPVWSFAAVVAEKDGSFTIVY